jgi:hypothetical protein
MNKLILPLAILIAVLFTSCTENNSLFKAQLKKQDDLTALSYLPKMQFDQIADSAATLLEPVDFHKILGGNIRKGATIYKNDKFSIKVLLLDNYATGMPKYQMMLRSYTSDMKIIDTYILANTTGDVMCDGFITPDLKITKSCDDDSEVIAQVNEYGKFIVEEK